jgi:hypothetical protein
MTKIWIVISDSDGGLAAYKTESAAVTARDTYHETGLYPYEETYIEEVFLVE